MEAIEAELELGNAEGAAQLVASIEAVPPGLRSPYLGAQAMRFRGRMADASDVAAEGLAAAAARFGELRVPFWQAVALLEHAELTDACRGTRDLRGAEGNAVARPGRDGGRLWPLGRTGLIKVVCPAVQQPSRKCSSTCIRTGRADFRGAGRRIAVNMR